MSRNVKIVIGIVALAGAGVVAYFIYKNLNKKSEKLAEKQPQRIAIRKEAISKALENKLASLRTQT